MLSLVNVLKPWHKGNRGSKLLGHCFWTKYDVIVVVATASISVIFLSDLSDHYLIACSVTGDPNRTSLKIKQDNLTATVILVNLNESNDSVETVAHRGLGGQKCLDMVFGQSMTSFLP